MTSGFFISRSRVYLLIGLLCVVWCTIAARLVNFQIIHGEEYRLIADHQTNGEIVVPAERGGIFDLKGRALAANVARLSFFAYPQSELDAIRIADLVAPLVEVPSKELRRTLASHIDSFSWICRKAPDNKSDALLEIKVPGI